MTDVIRPANGQAANAQSSGNGWQDLNGTSGYDAAIRERTLVAPESGEARAWPKRPGPGAESPAGWLLPTDGEAAPPSRPGMEPARSDKTAGPPGADGDVAAPGSGPAASPPYPLRALWPWTFQAGSRHVPVVGPTEALRGRTGGPGMAAPSARSRLARPGSALQLAARPGGMAGVRGDLGARCPRLADVDPAPGWLPDSQPLAFDPQDDDPWPANLPGLEPLAPSRRRRRRAGVRPEDPKSDDPHPAGRTLPPPARRHRAGWTRPRSPRASARPNRRRRLAGGPGAGEPEFGRPPSLLAVEDAAGHGPPNRARGRPGRRYVVHRRRPGRYPGFAGRRTRARRRRSRRPAWAPAVLRRLGRRAHGARAAFSSPAPSARRPGRRRSVGGGAASWA